MKDALPLLAVAAGLAIAAAAIVSCGGPIVDKHTHNGNQAKRQEITALWTQIREWRKEGGMRNLEPSSARKLSMRYKTSHQAAGICPYKPPPRTPKCQDACSLSENICQNAARICRIADKLGDDWSREKCNSAKASCNEAKKRCCKCRGE